ncbi:MAG: tRNA (adenosine(37)-N6)-dimethylallyltransferase MiaA [Opitutales bacterium]|nr:tRNA (adenosine(37)-N6)-dimethylallyltransferase MiaA [Opitutales bacterium]
MKLPSLIFVVGPTAVGKTALSLELAERLERPILSCDSLCFYRGMNIGTAKPTAEERERVTHYGIDLVDPSERYDIAQYLEYARHCVETHAESGLIISGGSGFYLKSFFEPVTDQVNVPESITREVHALYQKAGLEGLLQTLRKRNPAGTGNLDIKNPRRVEKALMRCMASGQTLQELENAFDRQPDPYADISRCVILLDRETTELKARIAQRTQQMLANGLIEEVRRLRDAGLERNPSGRNSIGYRETLQFLDGEFDQQTLEVEISLHTRQLVRKQRIWFRKQIPIDFKWNPDEIHVQEALNRLKSHDPARNHWK